MVGAVPVEFSAKGVDRGRCFAMDGAKRGLGRRGSMFSLHFLDGVVFSLSLLLGLAMRSPVHLSGVEDWVGT